MPFYDTRQSRKPYVTDDAKTAAKRHRQWCANHGWYISRQEKMWERPIQALMAQLGADRVNKILSWYHANHGPSKFRMKLKNGKEFADRFNLIETFIENDQEKNPTVVVSETAKTMVTALRGLNWVKGSLTQLPAAVQITLDSWHAFRKKLAGYCKTHPTEHSTGSPANLAHHLRQVLSYETPTIVQTHFRKAQHDTERWQKWNGNLLSKLYTWRGDLDDPEFTKIVLSMVTAYGCTSATWNKLKEQLR